MRHPTRVEVGARRSHGSASSAQGGWRLPRSRRPIASPRRLVLPPKGGSFGPGCSFTASRHRHGRRTDFDGPRRSSCLWIINGESSDGLPPVFSLRAQRTPSRRDREMTRGSIESAGGPRPYLVGRKSLRRAVGCPAGVRPPLSTPFRDASMATPAGSRHAGSAPSRASPRASTFQRSRCQESAEKAHPSRTEFGPTCPAS